MQVKRAHGPAETGRWTEPAEPARPAPRLAEGDRAGGSASPALLLRDELAARLAGLSQPDVKGGAIAEPLPETLPMPARLAVIVGLGLACWAMIGAAVAMFL